MAFRHQLAALIPFSLALITMVFVLEYSQWFVDQGYRRRSALGLVAIAWLIGAVLATPLVKRSLRVLPWSSESP